MVEMNNQKQVEKEIVKQAQQADAGNQGDETADNSVNADVSNDVRELLVQVEIQQIM